MTENERDKLSGKVNPFYVDLKARCEHFIKKATYYGKSEASIDSFKEAYNNVVGRRSWINDQKIIIKFMRELLEKFIAVEFHDNSYLQEDLVHIYECLHEMLDLRLRNHGAVCGSSDLFTTLLKMEPDIEASLQRGAIKYGFLKQRKWHQWSIFVLIRWVLLWNWWPVKSISQEGKALWQDAVEFQNNADGTRAHLRREMRHLREFYQATRESETAGVVFLSATIVFVVSVVFTVFRFVSLWGDSEAQWVDTLLDVTAGAAFATLFAALLAVQHLFRKQRHLWTLDRRLAGRAKTDVATCRVRRITRFQELITILRILANVFAIMALPVAVTHEWIGSDSKAGVYLAVIAVCLAVGSTVLFFLMEFSIRYNLPCALGKAVCEPFRDEIEEYYRSFSGPSLGLKPPDAVEKETWDYTSREFLSKYRFDTVLAADRFGTLFQHLQSGKVLEKEQ